MPKNKEPDQIETDATGGMNSQPQTRVQILRSLTEGEYREERRSSTPAHFGCFTQEETSRESLQHLLDLGGSGLTVKDIEHQLMRGQPRHMQTSQRPMLIPQQQATSPPPSSSREMHDATKIFSNSRSGGGMTQDDIDSERRDLQPSKGRVVFSPRVLSWDIPFTPDEFLRTGEIQVRNINEKIKALISESVATNEIPFVELRSLVGGISIMASGLYTNFWAPLSVRISISRKVREHYEFLPRCMAANESNAKHWSLSVMPGNTSVDNTTLRRTSKKVTETYLQSIGFEGTIKDINNPPYLLSKRQLNNEEMYEISFKHPYYIYAREMATENAVKGQERTAYPWHSLPKKKQAETIFSKLQEFCPLIQDQTQTAFVRAANMEGFIEFLEDSERSVITVEDLMYGLNIAVGRNMPLSQLGHDPYLASEASMIALKSGMVNDDAAVEEISKQLSKTRYVLHLELTTVVGILKC